MNPLFHLETISERSLFRNHPLGEKILFSMGSLLLVVIMPPLPFALFVSLALSLYLIRSGLSIRELLQLLLLPSSFLILAVLPLLVEIVGTGAGSGAEGGGMHGFGHFASFLPFRIRFSVTGFHRAVDAVFRSMSALLSVYSLTATTPLPQIFPVLRRLKIPETLIELTYFTYRMIHLFADAAFTMARSQRARGGEGSFRLQFRSRVLLLQRLNDRIRERVLRMERGLFSRGYDGELRFLSPETAASSIVGYLRILLLQMVLVIVSLTLPSLPGTLF